MRPRSRSGAVVAIIVAAALAVGSVSLLNAGATGATSAYVLATDRGDLAYFGSVESLSVPAGQTVDLVVVEAGRGVHLLSKDGSIRSSDTDWTPGPVDSSGWRQGEVAIAMVLTTTENGAWVVTSVGRVIALGDASPLGDLLTISLDEPVVDAAAVGDDGLFLLGGDGGIFSLGSAEFMGSVPQVLGNADLDQPLVAILVTNGGLGYWLVAADGGVFAFGDASFKGSVPQVLPGVTLNEKVVGAVNYGDGYLMVAGDGGVFNFSRLDFVGSLGNTPPVDPVVAISPVVVTPNSSGPTTSLPASGSSTTTATTTTTSTTTASTTTSSPTSTTTASTTTTSTTTTSTTTTTTTTTTTQPAAANASISIWHDPSPSFGHLGVPQRWVNVQGTATDPEGVSLVQYRLNSGAWTTMTLGPHPRRLAGQNHFNIDLAVASLSAGANNLDIRVTDTAFNQTTSSTTVTWTQGVVAPTTKTVTWSGVADPSSVAQPVDGQWQTVGPWLNNVDDGYDRIIAIGDQTWTNYEVTVPVVLNSIHPGAFDPPSWSPGLGFALRWNGHNDSVEPGSQPQLGFLPDGSNPTPFGAVMFWTDTPGRVPGFEIYDEWNTYRAGDHSFSLIPGTTYVFKAQVQGAGPTTYRWRIWQQGQPEPTTWNVEYTTPGNPSEPTSGSLALIAHEVDAFFGQVSVRPL